jgi:hypothetical protein
MLQQYVMQISIHLWDEGFRFHKALVIRVIWCASTANPNQ